MLLHLFSGVKIRKTHVSLMKRVKTQSTFIVLAITLLWLSNVSAATINATSCSQAHVQAAINSASPGDTVLVPAGNCTWSSGVSIPNDKKINLQGEGIDSTIITRDPAGEAVNLALSGSRVTGFSFTNGRICADGNGCRIDHCKLTFSSWTNGISIIGGKRRNPARHPAGLIDNCVLNNMRVRVIGSAFMLAEGPDQHELWSQPLGLGTNNAVFVEDCNFELDVFGNAIDTNYGGAYVFRFNHISGTYIECHSVQNNNRATRRWEIYGNTIGNPGSGSKYYPYRLRGGTGVVFNDIIYDGWTNYGIALDNVRSYADRGDGGFCNGDSTWDGNEDATGYPCRDQIGRGPDNPQWDHISPGIYTQPLVPVYAWENRRQSNNALVPFRVISSSQDHIQENRDFYNQTTTFDGTSGVGVGILAARPSTCTPGVAYWATDQGSWNKTLGGEQGVLYKCISKNTWEKYYEPYTYPHPLRQAEPIGEFQPPQNLRIEEHSLSVTTSGNGSVDVVPNQDTYSFGQQVTLTAMADPGWVFSGWSGDLAANDNPVTLTISGDHKVTATFADSAALAYSEGFEAYNDGDDPVDWLDTAANNNMSQDNSLFQVVDVGGEKVLGTASTLTNIHSYYTGSGSTVFSNYEYTGRMMMTESSGGIGVTLLSQYPVRDAYYRLRRYKSNSFHISPHGTSIFGVTDTGVVPIANNWYRFRVRVQDTGIRMEILAKVWLDGDVEPIDWQVNAYDDTDNRLTSGTFGVWSYLIGSKYWDDLMVIPLSP
jgi:hypothetical protein